MKNSITKNSITNSSITQKNSTTKLTIPYMAACGPISI